MKRISGLYIYPVKSCRGIAVNQTTVTKKGFALDRIFMVTDPNGTFLTQRDLPKLALIQPEIDGDMLVIGAPHMPEVAIPLEGLTGPRVEVAIWKKRFSAIDQGNVLPIILSAFLGKAVRLVRLLDEKETFLDAGPCHLLGEASLGDLNSRMKGHVLVNRFRPNIIVTGCEPFEEDGWRKIMVGDVVFKNQSQCIRCEITTIDQETGLRGKEPLKTLSGYRRTPGKGVVFGIYCAPLSGGEIRVGQVVSVLNRK